MLYRTFGNTGIQMSVLGFGAMRLPMMEKDGQKAVDEDLAVPMMRRAFDLGVNYVDSAPFYCEAQSEIAVGKALKGYRDKVYLSTKNNVDNDSGDDWTKRLEGSLKKLDTDYIDFYHMWGIGKEDFHNKVNKKDGPIDAARRAKEQGLIKHLSFSFHDDAANMQEIIDSGYFESVLMQYNLLDQANAANIDYAKEHGLGVVIMGPVGGGRLGAPSAVIQGLLQGKVKSTAEMALRFVLANQNVTVALSGMSTMEQVEENAAVASIPGALTDAEKAQVNEMMEENKRLAELYCTGCNYCMPCPQEVNIPHVFRLMNLHRVYGLTDYARKEYAHFLSGKSWEKGQGAAACVECGQCESKCPQKLEIIRQLKESEQALN